MQLLRSCWDLVYSVLTESSKQSTLGGVPVISPKGHDFCLFNDEVPLSKVGKTIIKLSTYLLIF